MMRFNGDSLRNSAVIFVIAYSIMPVVSRLVSTYMTTYSYMLFLVLFLLLILVGKKLTSVDEYIYHLFPFLLYGALTYFTNTDSIVMWGYSFMIFVMPVIIGNFIISYYRKDCNKYGLAIVLCIAVTCITTIRGLQLYPDAARWLATASDSQSERVVRYSNMNIGGYDFVYKAVLLYPLLVLAFKKGKIGLFKTVVLASIILSCLILCDYTTALILFFSTSVMFFMKRKLSSRDVVTFFAISLFFMLLFSSFTSNVLRYIAGNVESENVSMRLTELAEGGASLKQSEDKRWDFYMASVNSFLRYPLGSAFAGRSRTGGHSFVLDFIGQYGLFGIFVLCFMYRKLYYLFYKEYRLKEDFGYVLWVFVQAILLSVLNTGMWVDVLALYVPLILCMLYGGDKNEENSLDSERAA